MMSAAIRRWCVLSISAACLLSACAGGGLAPVINQSTEAQRRAQVERDADRLTTAPGAAPPFHVIAPGETLFSIAWRYGLDFKQLAQWNGIVPPYVIYAGRGLSLRPPERSAMRSAATGTSAQTQTRVAATAPRGESSPPASAGVRREAGTASPDAAEPSAAAITWQWPSAGTVVSADSALGQKGINILGRMGQPVVAAAAGKVVYSGSGLVGYGKLIIIKHDEVFLSAYAHNEELLVNEGTTVAAGQKIAEMGSTGTKQVMLHFEIRRNGKPVPPLQYLPKQP